MYDFFSLYTPFVYILSPFVGITVYLYERLWVTQEFTYLHAYRLYDYPWTIFPESILASLSGIGYLIQNSGYAVWESILFGLCVAIISITLDTIILTWVSRYNQHRLWKDASEKRNTYFLWIYSFWRMLLPDFFVIGALIARITGMTCTKSQLLKYNSILQGIRACLFVGFAITYYMLRG